MSRLHGQLVTLGTESGNHAGRDVREERMLPEVLTRKNVGQVHLDERDGDAQQGISQGDAGMREAAEIDEHESGAVDPGQLDPVDQRGLGIALQGVELVAGGRALFAQAPVDVIERVTAVDMRLPMPQQIQIGPVQGQDFRHTTHRNCQFRR